VLFALNERYLINEKGAVAAAGRLTLRVPTFRATVEEVLSRPGAKPSELRERLQRLEGVVLAARTLVTELIVEE